MNESFHLVDTAYLQSENGDQLQVEEREMINLLLRWTGGNDHKTLFPGKLPWGHKDGVTLAMMKALMQSGAGMALGQKECAP